jgi:N-acetylmuramoyl-L-alanine amidase
MRRTALLSLTALLSGCSLMGVADRSPVATPAAPVALAPVELEQPDLPVVAPPPPAWKRPAGPLRVALQAGHWKAADAPEEQAHLRVNGTRGGGLAEWQVNLGIARRAADMLRDAGYLVEVLPTTIPPGYWADLFIAIHADGSPSPQVSGYRAAAPRRDETGRAEEFAMLLERSYGEATGLPFYPLVTRRMRGYYAFNSLGYEHALHPMTVGVILETGFLTSPRDRGVIVNGQDRAARGIVAAVQRFFEPKPREPRPLPTAE